MRDIGLHLRLQGSVYHAAQKALDMNLPIFQCFFLDQDSNKFLIPPAKEIEAFKKVRDNFKQLYVHSTYWTNLASIKSISLRVIRNEISLAKKLGFTHLILHPGSAKGAQDIQEGIDAVARRLNILLKNEHDLQLVLENTAHGKLSVGSNLEDFKLIMEKLDRPERVSFCIDTVHAHAFGYNIANIDQQKHFLHTIEQTIGFDKIALIHLNNTRASEGSCIDRHALLTDGIIDMQALKAFVLDPRLASVPIVMELPVAHAAVEQEHVDLVRMWHK